MSVAALLSLDEATAAVLAHCRRLPTEEVPVAQAAGRFLAETVLAAVDLPPFPASAMDGFALRAADTPGTLAVVDRIAAGRPAARSLGPGEAMGIATGGVVPEGADAVVPIEEVADHDAEVEVPAAVDKGSNIRAGRQGHRARRGARARRKPARRREDRRPRRSGRRDRRLCAAPACGCA